MNVTPFPNAPRHDGRAPDAAVWIRADPQAFGFYRVHWRTVGRTGCHPSDRGVTLPVAVWCAARIANHRSCRPADPLVARLVAGGFGR
jgi:hypothetical protein